MDEQFLSYVANILSTITIFSCLFLKVPQISYVKARRSAKGIYVQAMLLEITGFTIVTLYNYVNSYSIMTYMEYPIILLQIYLLLFYVLKYQKLLKMTIVPIVALIYVLVVTAFVVGWLPCRLLSYMVPMCTPISGFAKITYIYGIIRARNADSVSTITWMISIATNLSRIFTVYVDSADIKLMLNFSVSACLSAGVLVTALIYQYKLLPKFIIHSSGKFSSKSHKD